MIFPQILSINSTKLSTIAWAKENAGIAVVPASPGEIFDNDLICKIIRDDRLFLNKTLSIVKGRPLSNVSPTVFKLIFHSIPKLQKLFKKVKL